MIRIFGSSVILSFCLLVASPAFAIGLGGSIGVHAGSAEWEIESDILDFEDDGDLLGVSIGFVFDTGPARDRVFGYRVNVSLEGIEADLDDTDDTADLGGISFDNSFCFQVHHSEEVRLWVGPHLILGLYGGELESLSDVDVALVQFGFGGEFGADFHVGERLTLGTTVGFTLSGYAGEVELFDEDDEVTGFGPSVFVKLVMIARLGADAH